MKIKRKSTTKKTGTVTRVSAKQIAKDILIAVIYCAWIFAVLMATQYLMAYLMKAILPPEILAKTITQAIHSLITYILSFVIIYYITPVFTAIFRKEPSKNSKKAAQKEAAKTKSAEKSDKDELKLSLTLRIQNAKLMSRKDLGLEGLPTWTDIGLAPVGLVVTLILSTIASAIFSNFAWYNAGEAQELNFGNFLIGGDRIIAFVILALVAPIAEELIFRGWLYGKVRNLLHGKVSERVGVTISVILVSLTFALVHQHFNVQLTVFIMSVVMCLMREITGTIYAGILLHMLKNGLAFFMIYVIGMGFGAA